MKKQKIVTLAGVEYRITVENTDYFGQKWSVSIDRCFDDLDAKVWRSEYHALVRNSLRPYIEELKQEIQDMPHHTISKQTFESACKNNLPELTRIQQGKAMEVARGIKEIESFRGPAFFPFIKYKNRLFFGLIPITTKYFVGTTVTKTKSISGPQSLLSTTIGFRLVCDKSLQLPFFTIDAAAKALQHAVEHFEKYN